MNLLAQITNPGTLQIVEPSEQNSLRETFYFRDVEVKTYICVMGEARQVDLVLHLTGKMAKEFNPEHKWICADIYPTSRKFMSQMGNECVRTEILVKNLAGVVDVYLAGVVGI